MAVKTCEELYSCPIKAKGYCQGDREVTAQAAYLGKVKGFSEAGFENALQNYEAMIPFCLDKEVFERSVANARNKASEYFGSIKTDSSEE